MDHPAGRVATPAGNAPKRSSDTPVALRAGDYAERPGRAGQLAV